MAAYPFLAFGGEAHLPYVRRHEFLTARVDMPTGWRHSYFWRSTELLRWDLQYTNLSDADLALLVNFYASMFGRYGEFDFTDPENAVLYTKVRFDMDELPVQHLGPNQHNLTVRLAQYS